MKAALVFSLLLTFGISAKATDTMPAKDAKSAAAATVDKAAPAADAKAEMGHSCNGEKCPCKEKSCSCKDKAHHGKGHHKGHDHAKGHEHKAGEKCDCACKDKACHADKAS